jgi:hypothetical protein
MHLEYFLHMQYIVCSTEKNMLINDAIRKVESDRLHTNVVPLFFEINGYRLFWSFSLLTQQKGFKEECNSKD